MTPFHVHVQTTLHAFQDLSNEWSILHALALCHASEKEPHFRSSRQLVVPFVILVAAADSRVRSRGNSLERYWKSVYLYWNL